MASLLDCPNEIQLDIMRNFVPTTWNNLPTSLYSMCLVNKRLYSLSQSLLYSRIHLACEDENAVAPRIPLLLRSLIDRPSLGNYVEHLSLEGGEELPLFTQDDWVPHVNMAAVDEEKIIEFINSTQIDAEDMHMWRCEVTEPLLDGTVAALLALLPALKSLSMGPAFTVQMGMTNCMLQYALSPERAKKPNRLPRFEKLRSVTLKNEKLVFCDHGYWECVLLPFFHLPELEHISLAIHLGCHWIPSTPNLSNLTSLELHRIQPDELAKLLSITTGLKKLSWTCHCYPTDNQLLDEFIDFIHLDMVDEALFRARETLEEVVLKLDDGNQDFLTLALDPMDIELKGSLDLSPLVHLKKLQAPWVWLMDWSPDPERILHDCIPESLESLVLTMDLDTQMAWEWDESLLFEWMAAFLEAQRGFTNLRLVVLESCGALANTWEHGELQVLAAEAGIVLQIEPDAS